MNIRAFAPKKRTLHFAYDCIKMLQIVSEHDQEIQQSHTADNPRHHDEEPQNIYSSNTFVRQ